MAGRSNLPWAPLTQPSPEGEGSICPMPLWLLIAPLLAVIAGAYALPLLGVVRWSVTLPTPGIGPV